MPTYITSKEDAELEKARELARRNLRAIPQTLWGLWVTYRARYVHRTPELWAAWIRKAHDTVQLRRVHRR